MLKRIALCLLIAVLLPVAVGAAGCGSDGGSGSVASVAAAGTSAPAGLSDAGGASATTQTSVATQTSADGAATTNAGAEGTTTTSAGTEYAATDATYESDTTSISISTVSTGTGRSAVTYYVADVLLAPGTLLQAGLADGFQQGNVDYTSSIAEANDAILAINGDYCTARNTGIIIRNGVLYLDNPTRAGLALYKDGTMAVYDETEVSAEQLLADGVYNTYSFGPALVVDGQVQDDLNETEVEDIGERHTILGNQPRTGVGIVDANHYVFVVVDGRSTGYSIGLELEDFAEIFEQLGCTTAYNLDGGGSSAMYFMGELVNTPLGSGKERGISDILFVG